MPKSRATQRQLGQYWTPEVLADFMLDIAQFQPHWKVIDPACGEGVFLKRALERGAQQVVGIDIDPETLERARENLKPYGDRVRLYLQDGLLPIEDPDPYWQSDYDLVIGNPPFAATGYRVRDPKILERFELAQEPVSEPQGQSSLFESDEYRPKRRKPSVAIEVLFLERFFQLCKPGGVVCVIVPRGILANRNLMYVRKWLTTHYSLRCVFDMPQEAFKSVGANALASILLVDKCPIKKGAKAMLVYLSDVDWSAPYDAPSNAWLRTLAEIANLSTNRAREGKPPPKLSARQPRKPPCTDAK
ncbi:HsdM family class I SAM-dependent methyltransferase [Synechococcus sp. RC10A2]|jgi:predicted RNA methylase|uniref:HsdM family class I SAM-dependent methyltransferase n=1 Tax=Synechococcus sp. RC10A2 TaxID=2964529 RepID=UPI0039C6727C